MAKIGLTKLNLKKNTDVEIITWNEQEIEIKQYLPIEEKLSLISNIVNASVDNNGYYNPAQVYIYTIVYIIENYTNLNITEKQKEDIFKLYDMFAGSGFSAKIFQNINPGEIRQIQSWISELITSIYEYKNSALGILDSVKEDYSGLEFEAENIQKVLDNKEDIGFLKEIVDKLG